MNVENQDRFQIWLPRFAFKAMVTLKLARTDPVLLVLGDI